MTRNPRQRQARGRSRVGERFTAVVGPVAHGGHFVVRLPGPPEHPGDSRVVFTRHALPGEEVVVEITEGTEGDRFWRGDAVSILTASADRVAAPCQYAGPDLCGGCDFQHVALPAQRELKAAVVREQLVRLGHLDPDDPLLTDLVVEAVSADDPAVDLGLRWRTRMQYVGLPGGTHGLRVHRSRDVVEVDDCLIAHPDALEVIVPFDDVVVASTGSTHRSTGSTTRRSEPVVETVRGREFQVSADGFWQVHPGAPTILVETVLDYLNPQPGDKALDLYSGAGLYSVFLAERVGDTGRVVAIEANRVACEHAKLNLAGLSRASVEVGSVDRVLDASYDEPFDLVVLDPPREGARRKVVEVVVDRAPRAIAYVACDPAALARDLAIFAEHGYPMTRLRVLDLFPMTHHVECVALLER